MKSKIKRSVGPYLAACRRKKGLTQEDIAEYFEFENAQFVSNVERGVSGVPLVRLYDWIDLVKADEGKTVKFMLHDYEQVIKEALS